MGDHYHTGRRTSIILSNGLTFASGFASAFAPNIWSLIVLRGILGIGIAGNSLIPYTLFLETLPQGYAYAAPQSFYANIKALGKYCAN